MEGQRNTQKMHIKGNNTHVSILLSICLYLYLSAFVFIYLFINSSVYQSIYTSKCMYICKYSIIHLFDTNQKLKVKAKLTKLWSYRTTFCDVRETDANAT